MVRAADLLARLVAAIDDEVPAAVRLRHRLHADPELGAAEYRTAATITGALPVPVTEFFGTGRLAGVGPVAAPAVWVRAEMDALAMAEATGAPFAATNGLTHACGHDVHLAALVALVRAAHRMAGDLPARLVAVFQPSEERHPSGAVALISDPDLTRGVVAAVAAHVHPDLPWGALGLEPGPVNAAADAARVVITGRGGHAAYPQRTADPVLAMAHVVVGLSGLVGRRLDPTHAATLAVGAVHAGAAENVIPDRAEALVTLRALDPEDQRTLREATVDLVEHTARAHRCTAEVTYTKSDPPLINDPTLTAAARDLAGGAGFEVAPPWRSCGGDDFAHIGAVCPSLMAFVGLSGAPGFTPGVLHDPRFLPPDESVRVVARALALAYLAAAA